MENNNNENQNLNVLSPNNNNEQLNNNNNNNNVINTISHNNIESPTKIYNPVRYCCNSKKRIYLKNNSIVIVIIIIFFIILPILLLNIIIFPKMKSKKYKIINYIFGNIIFIINVLSYLNVVTSSPGYEETINQISENEYNELKPIVTIKGNKYNLKYCSTCKIIRQLRTFHCSQCGKCVLKHDHHCEFINNCVGKNNHLKFISFLLCVSLSSIFCVLNSILIPLKEHKNMGIIRTIFLIVLGIICAYIFLSLFPFSCFHLYLISINMTTREDIKDSNYVKSVNNGFCENWKEVCSD